MANLYRCRPSDLLGISDPYTAYCFDEACAYISVKMEEGEEPRFGKHFSSFSDMYQHYGV